MLEDYKPSRFMAKGSYYDAEKADRAVNFIECLKQSKGQWAGQQFKLLAWQEKIIRDIFGTIKPNGYRQFTQVYVEIPKKTENLCLQVLLRFIFYARTAKKARKYTVVPEIGNRQV